MNDMLMLSYLMKATCDVIDEFAADGVVYLELRSTPRAIPNSGVTQQTYMETILRAIANKTSTIEQLTRFEVGRAGDSLEK